VFFFLGFLGLVAMMGRMQLAGFLGVMCRVQVMTMGDMGVMGGGFGVAALVMVGGMLMMLGGLRMEFRGLAMVLDDMLGMRHGTLQRGGRDVRVARV
jgi:hypothetical protein